MTVASATGNAGRQTVTTTDSQLAAMEVIGMKCQACGAELPDNAKFCNECGTKYEPPVQQPASVVSAVLVRKMVYSIKEAAASLNISERKLRELVSKNQITVTRQGRCVGISEWALEAYVKAHEGCEGERACLKII